MLLRIALLYLLLCGVNLQAADIEINQSDLALNIGPKLEYLVTDRDAHTLTSLLGSSASFQPLSSSTFSSGSEINHFWFRARVRNQLQTSSLWLFMENIASNVDVYVVDSRNQVLMQVSNGERIPLSKRPVANPNLIFPLQIPTDETVTLYINMRAEHVVRSVFILGTPQAVTKAQNPRYFLAVALLVLVLFLAFYNLVIYLIVKDTLYLYYVLYVLFGSLGQLCLVGSLGLLFPSFTAPPSLVFVFHCLTLTLLALFSSRFLTPEDGGVARNIFNGFVVVGLLAIVYAAVVPVVNISYLHVIFMLFAFWLVAYSSKQAFTGSLSARLFVLGWYSYIFAFTLLILENQRIIAPMEWGLFLTPIGQTIEMILFAAALAFRVKELIKDRDALQNEREAMFEQGRRDLENSNEAKDNFLSMITHELRTPLHGIIGNTEMLLSNIKGDNATQYARESLLAANRLNRVIDGILIFSEAQHNRLGLKWQTHSIQRVVRLLVSEYRESVPESIQFEWQMDSDIPNWIRFDASLFRKTITPLLDNAIEFTYEGQVRLSLSREPGKPHDFLLVRVIDTGSGISETDQRRIFKAFQQVESGLTRNHGGVGLGLAVAKQLALLQGGDLSLEYSSETGSCFLFRLPLMEEKSSNVTQLRKSDAKVESKIRILVVEDDRANQLVMQKMLGLLGVECDLADNGAMALEMVSKKQWHLIFMDCQMPILDGVQAAAKMRAQGGWLTHVPIIAVSADSAAINQQRCIEVGMNHFIAKPMSLNSLRQILMEYQLLGSPGVKSDNPF